MKILFCTNSFENVTNGPAKFANLLLQINSVIPETELRILTEDISIEQPGVYKINLSIPKLLRPAGMILRMFQYYKRAKRIYKQEYKFDVLVYNNAIISLYSAIASKNVIGFINDDNYVSAGLKLNIFRRHVLRSNLFFCFEWLAGRFLDKIVVNSDYLRNKIISVYHVKPEKIVKLYKAVEVKPERIIRNNPVPVILFVKNDFRRGGLQILANALRTLNKKFVCIIVGTPPSSDTEIKKWFNHPNLEIVLKGYQSQQAVYDLMRKADIFCVPSLREALGVSNIEAMRFGCSVVTTNTGGIPETTGHGACAWIVHPGDSIALANAIDTCLTNHIIRQKKIESAYVYSENFSVAKMIRNFLLILGDYERETHN